MSATRPIAFAVITEDSYAVHAATFDIEETVDRTIVLRGSCRRCDHPMEYMVAGRVVKGLGADVTTRPQSKLEPMFCTCQMDHPGRPAEYDGCGAYWDLEITS
jgi:hypothetical protein